MKQSNLHQRSTNNVKLLGVFGLLFPIRASSHPGGNLVPPECGESGRPKIGLEIIAMRIMDLPDWPPKPAEPYERKSISIGEVQIERVNGDVEGHVSFVCKRYGESIPYDFFIWDKKNSIKFQKILNENYGVTLFDIGFIALPPD